MSSNNLSKEESAALAILLKKAGYGGSLPAPVALARKVTPLTNPGTLRGDGGAFVGGSGTVVVNNIRGAFYAAEACDYLANASHILVLIKDGGGKNRTGEAQGLTFNEVRDGKGGAVIVTAEEQRKRIEAMANDSAVLKAAIALSEALRAHNSK